MIEIMGCQRRQLDHRTFLFGPRQERHADRATICLLRSLGVDDVYEMLQWVHGTPQVAISPGVVVASQCNSCCSAVQCRMRASLLPTSMPA
jgi:hypothetical protein